MALSPEEKWILVAIFSVLGFLAVYFEVRYMRSKGKEVQVANQRKDEAYNSILTTRSVINVMQSRGANTKAAEALVSSARMAMQRGDYDRCSTLCEQARHELTNPSKAPATTEERAADSSDLEMVAESILRSETQPTSPDYYSGTKLAVDKDGNYLSAKFEINKAKTDLKGAVDQGLETSEAQGFLTDAEGAFVAGNYTKALSLAVRARKAINSEATDETIPLKKVKDEFEEEIIPEESLGSPSLRCRECNTLLDTGDTFCGTCGAKVLVERICENCGAKSKASDKFCRKCGASLG